MAKFLMKASRGEIKISEILDSLGLKYIEEYSFTGLRSPNGKPLRFDFAVFDDDDQLQFLIEYQGRQHYEAVSKFGGKRGLFQQQYNDTQKRKFCKFHNINLIEIPYTDYDAVDADYIMSKTRYC